MSIALKQAIEKIVSLTDEEFEWVLSHFTLKNFRKHQIIIQEGELVKYDYFVINGLLKASRTTSEGKEHITQFALESDWITDSEAYHYGNEATLSVDCVEKTQVLAITLDNKEKLCKEFQKMEHFFRKKSTENYIILQKRIMCFISTKANERYHYLLA